MKPRSQQTLALAALLFANGCGSSTGSVAPLTDAERAAVAQEDQAVEDAERQQQKRSATIE
jgi:hypothetical protein